jgi:hypothetical protein
MPGELAALAGNVFTTGVEFAATARAAVVIVTAVLVSIVLRNVQAPAVSSSAGSHVDDAV